MAFYGDGTRKPVALFCRPLASEKGMWVDQYGGLNGSRDLKLDHVTDNVHPTGKAHQIGKIRTFYHVYDEKTKTNILLRLPKRNKDTYREAKIKNDCIRGKCLKDGSIRPEGQIHSFDEKCLLLILGLNPFVGPVRAGPFG